MEQRIRRSQKDYSLAFKLSVVEQVEKGEMTYKEAQKRYGIKRVAAKDESRRRRKSVGALGR